MMKKIFLLLFLLAGFLQTFAQERTISGVVTSASDGTPLPGVNVSVKERMHGTVTDAEGRYSLTVTSEDRTLVFSFVSMKTEEVVIGQQSTIDVALESDVLGLDEVVVTALGIRKEKKSLGYAVEKVEGKELVEGNQTNLVNALQGKVAGISVTNSGGAPGASSVIMIRGGNSLSGDNQPLFVVDGIPVDNSTVGGSLVANSNRGLDINSEDIESVSILKGPAAAAMYGLKAANGAIVITTKSGEAGKAEISYNGSFSIDNVISVPEIQMQYGQGEKMDNGTFNPYTTYSWDTVKLGASAPKYNNIEDFYQAGYMQNHNLSYSGGSDRSTIYASIGRLDQDGVIDRTSYDRTSFKIKINSSLKRNLTVGASFNYVNSNSERTRQGSANSGSFRSVLNYPINIDMKDYLNEDGSQKIIEGLGDQPSDNPYWSAKNNPITNKVDRYIGIGSISYDPLKFLNITYRLGSDLFIEKNESVYAYGSMTYDQGYIGEYEAYNRITTSTLLLNGNHQINTHNFGITLGNNVEDYYRRSTSWSGQDFIEVDFVGINNIESQNRTVGQNITRKRMVSVFGEIKYDWNSLVFLNITGRYDKSSTLPKDDNGFFYPSVGVSVLLSDILENMAVTALSDIGISYWKLRATYAQVGKDAPAHVLYTPMASATNSFTIDPEGFMRATFPTGNPGLMPEFTSSFEIGTDIRLFQNRVGIDFSYYNSTSDEQILNVRMPPTASTWGGYLNGGSITNKGIEALIISRPVDRTDFTWDLDVNFSRARNHVNDLPGTIPQVENSDSWAFNSIAEGASFLNGTVFGIYGSVYMRDEDGNLLLDEDGMVQEEEFFTKLGDRFPDWTMGITNRLQYKDFILNFLIDITQGNDVLNGTRAALAYYGMDPVTLNRGTTKVFEGLRSTGVLDGEGNLIYEPNTQAVVLDQDYYQNIYSQVGENFVEDGSWVRLRYITLTYNLPTRWFGDRISLAQINLTGRNLIVITDYSGVDPEINTIGAAVQGTGSIGIDNLGTPSYKGFDISVRLTF